MSNPPIWLSIAQAVGAISTTVGVLIALYVAVRREPKKAAEERKRHEAQMDALNRAETERVAAQARKIVPGCVRTPMFGNTWWTVKIENVSNAAATILSVDVDAVDNNGDVVPNACQQSNNTLPADQAFEKAIRGAMSGSLQGAFQQSGIGRIIPQGAAQQLTNQLAPAVKQAMQEAMVGHFVTEWQRTLGPNQSALMAYTTTDPMFKLRITIEYEDEAGYQWRRTDTSQPVRTDKVPA
ncbi:MULTISPECIES: hypothetical protein [Mycobacterium]|uniref:Uncharacterized protein n=1 Tax=Mycobacterium kiyosense TaxID=2871094 RepID=A0A9P3Q4U6_9MYCO|nr:MULTISPECIES: hypothetical protein [Mycobacterium]BDB41534.1 hypothetical protein IWGMT90018_19800 [Mycobacterium kiyosense]BDE15164.1 hypothetical protein MKCMC460_40240 [Mycobacterium sp. 20KCMC460]GLB81647.1 hypothetical protein SRL2020028_09030 [Mycobacterium kiyosense]GLB87574.1 hypothetical protein SRL2020130_03910 [Mycobacterium kiyosense]GLB94227.1 hypothetical protein SRL2020226_10030 [Mycobacterium kiyosense]